MASSRVDGLDQFVVGKETAKPCELFFHFLIPITVDLVYTLRSAAVKSTELMYFRHEETSIWKREGGGVTPSLTNRHSRWLVSDPLKEDGICMLVNPSFSSTFLRR